MHSNGHHHIPPVVTVQEFTEDVVARHIAIGPRYRRALMIFGVLFLLGVAAFVAKAATDGIGVDKRASWGYLAAITAYLLTTAGTAPLALIGLRAIKAHWRRPLARLAELYGLVTVLILLLVVALMFFIPSAMNRRTMYFQSDGVTFPGTLGKIPGAPHVYDLVLLLALVAGGIGLWWLSARADKGLIADHQGKPRNTFWGTAKQWKVQQVGLGLLGAAYFITAVGFITFFSIDFAMALAPGWKDAIFAPLQGITGLQGGLATLILSMYVLRRWGHFERYIFMEHFWAASKILLALCLLWFYFSWSAFIIFWYGRQPAEFSVMQLLYFGPYEWFFYGAFLFCFVAPFLTLLWNSVRKSATGPAIAAGMILVGNLFDKIRLYAGTWSVPNDQIADHAMSSVPLVRYPNALDIMMMVGAVSGALFIVLWMGRKAPIVSMWEMSEGLRLRVVRNFLRTRLTVLGKPE